MIQIDMKKPSACRWIDEENNIHLCPFLDREYECLLQGYIGYWSWDGQYKNCPLHKVTAMNIEHTENGGKSMESWKERMINEYREVKDRYEKLHKMLVKYDAGKLEFTPSCPIDLLREQASVMGRYLYILEERACIEDIELV